MLKFFVNKTRLPRNRKSRFSHLVNAISIIIQRILFLKREHTSRWHKISIIARKGPRPATSSGFRISRPTRSRLVHAALMNVRIMSIRAVHFRSHASSGAWQPSGMTCPESANASRPLLVPAFLVFAARHGSTCRAGKKEGKKRQEKTAMQRFDVSLLRDPEFRCTSSPRMLLR